MSTITIQRMSFAYPGQSPLFHDCHLDLSTTWKLGLLGRNGRGKTTLMKILLGKRDYQGTVNLPVQCVYYPLTIKDKDQFAGEALLDACQESQLEQWQIEKELNLMHADPAILWQPYSTLSGGERTKCQLAALFAQPGKFLLLDEPTNHLDMPSRQQVADYLRHKQQGLIIISHDQHFLDQVINHTLVIERQHLILEQGNYSTYLNQKQRRDTQAIHTNHQLQAAIHQLQQSRQQHQQWAQQAENEKRHNSHADKGFIGAKAARMMKKTVTTTHRLDQAIQERQGLMTEVEKIEPLTLHLQETHHQRLLALQDLFLQINGRQLFQPISLVVHQHEQVALLGPNGVGKSSIIQAIRGDFPGTIQGQIEIAHQLQISYVRQDYTSNHGSLESFAKDHHLSYEELLNVLRKLGLSRQTFNVPIQEMSMGQQKKVELARSLVTPAQLYIWDEPVNYLDIANQQQLIQVIHDFQPPLLFVEHDQHFINAVATRRVHVTPQQ